MKRSSKLAVKESFVEKKEKWKMKMLTFHPIISNFSQGKSIVICFF